MTSIQTMRQPTSGVAGAVPESRPWVAPGPPHPAPVGEPVGLGFGTGPHPPPPPRPARARTRNSAWLVALTVAASVLGLVGLAVGAALASGASLAERRLSDPRNQVTVTLPWTWSDLTAPDAGKTVDYGKDDSDHIPDIEAQSNFDSSYLAVQVFTENISDAAREHLDFVEHTCTDLGCTDRGRVDTIQIDGQQAYQQVLTHPSSPDYPPFHSLVTTIRTPHRLTVLVVEQDVDDPLGLDAARHIVASTQIQD